MRRKNLDRLYARIGSPNSYTRALYTLVRVYDIARAYRELH